MQGVTWLREVSLPGPSGRVDVDSAHVCRCRTIYLPVGLRKITANEKRVEGVARCNRISLGGLLSCLCLDGFGEAHGVETLRCDLS